MDVAEFVSRARELLTPILSESGTVLYSSCDTLRRGDYYFLGLNPGGDPGDPGNDTIDESLNTLLEKRSNSYTDEDWSGRRKYDPGGHPLQRRVGQLFDALHTRVEHVCASNLIFSRSAGAGGAGYPSKAHICWPVHQLILEIVQPRAIIVFGKQPFEFIAAKLNAQMLPDIPTGRGDWMCHVADLAPGQRLVGLPHLSWLKPSDSLLVRIRDSASAAKQADA